MLFSKNNEIFLSVSSRHIDRLVALLSSTKGRCYFPSSLSLLKQASCYDNDNDNDNAGKVVVGGGSEKKTNFMEPTVVSGVKLDDPLMKVLDKQTKSKDVKNDKKTRYDDKHLF